MPTGIIDEEKMSLIMKDVILAETYAQNMPLLADTIRLKMDSFYNLIAAKHKITKQELLKNLNWYAKHPEIFARPVSVALDSLNAKQ